MAVADFFLPTGGLTMPTTVKITVLTGPHKNRRFCFQRPGRCIVGRASDCFLQLIGTNRDCLISRHHCQMDINPPSVIVQDLGSLNGTYLNGTKLQPPEEDLSGVTTQVLEKIASSAVEDGDVLTVAGTSLRIDIVDCPPSNLDLDAGRPYWNEGEVAKRDCPFSC
jgi:eukaryotic-like serine/threonine-protein kinase